MKINDRGPFHAERLIDLSFAAAVSLTFIRPEPRPCVLKFWNNQAGRTATESEQSYYLHAGQFSSEDQAESALGRLASLGPLSVQIIALERGGFALRIGPIASKRAQSIAGTVNCVRHWIAHAGSGTLVFKFQGSF